MIVPTLKLFRRAPGLEHPLANSNLISPFSPPFPRPGPLPWTGIPNLNCERSQPCFYTP